MAEKQILVAGIDFTDSSPLVLRHTMQSAKSRGAALKVVHVIDQSRLKMREASGLENPSFELFETEAKRKFAELLGDSSEGVDLEFLVRIGDPADELNQVAEASGAELLVLAANDMTKKRLGSIAGRCVRTASCDVMILRDWHGFEFKNISVCVNFSAASERAIERAAGLAKESDALLKIINVMYPPSLDGWGEVMDHSADSPIPYGEECGAKVQERMAKSLGRVESALQGVRYETVILQSTSAAEAITDYVNATGAELVVLGTRKRSALGSHFLSTNAERLIQDAPVSVLAVR